MAEVRIGVHMFKQARGPTVRLTSCFGSLFIGNPVGSGIIQTTPNHWETASKSSKVKAPALDAFRKTFTNRTVKKLVSFSWARQIFPKMSWNSRWFQRSHRQRFVAATALQASSSGMHNSDSPPPRLFHRCSAQTIGIDLERLSKPPLVAEERSPRI